MSDFFKKKISPQTFGVHCVNASPQHTRPLYYHYKDKKLGAGL
jgi:hypothetical protein